MTHLPDTQNHEISQENGSRRERKHTDRVPPKDLKKPQNT